MKISKIFYFLFLLISIISCEKEEDIGNQLDFSNLTITISNIETTTARISLSGTYIGGDEQQLLYKERGSTDAYQSVSINNNDFVLSNLDKATNYEIKLEGSTNRESIQSDSYYFTTKAVLFDYARFYDFSESQEQTTPTLNFSHSGFL